MKKIIEPITTVKKEGDHEIETTHIASKYGFSMPMFKKKVYVCKKCGNRFYPRRAGHDICYDCFNKED